MSNSKSKGSSNSSNYKLVANNKEAFEKTRWKMTLLRQAKLDLLENMNFDNSLVNRNNLADQISKSRCLNWEKNKNIRIPEGNIVMGTNPELTVNIDLDKYGMKWEYESLIKEINDLKSRWWSAEEIDKKNKRLRELDSILAERCILDNWWSIEFKSTDIFESKRNANKESRFAYDELNELDEYKWKIELISKRKSGVNYYVIKWTDEQIKKIRQRFEELSAEADEKKKAELENNGWDKDDKDKMEALIKKLIEDWEAKDKRIAELEDLLKNKEEGDEDGESQWSIETGDDTQQWSTETGDDESQWSIETGDDTQQWSTETGDNESPWSIETGDNTPQWFTGTRGGSQQWSTGSRGSTQQWPTETGDDTQQWSTETGDDTQQWSTETGDENHFEQKEWLATISNVSQVNRAIVQREVDEELRQRYKDTSWFNFIWKGNLFLRRKYIKDRMVNGRMNGRRWMDWSEASQAAADRHQIEEQNNLAERMQVVISDIDSANYPETRRRLDDLLWRLTWRANTVPPRQREISDANFQTEFQNILNMSWRIFDRTRPWTATSTNWRPISEIIRSNNIWQLSTNVLMQANKFREQQFLTWSIADHIAMNPLENDRTFDAYCRTAIRQFINSYNDMPDFLEQMWVKLDDVNATREIKRLQAHNWALTMIAAQSLKIRIQMLDDGWEAYNVKKQGGLLTKIWRFFDDPTWWENTKFGRWMNKHQNLKEAFWWVWWGAKIWMMMTPAFLLAPMGPLAVASWVWGMSFLTTLVKKKAHYERENRSYQRMQATNLTDYRNRRAALANEVAGMHWYEGRFWGEKARIRRQYKDYILTTQDQLSLSPDLLGRIERRLQDSNALSTAEQINLAADLADGLARLDYHRKTWQNFLWSDNPWIAEAEYRALQNAIMWWVKRLGIQVDDLRSTVPYDAYYNNTITLIEQWLWDDFDTQGYLRARRKFRNRSNMKAWVGAFKAWAISFGLSYLASSLASGNKTTTRETTNNVSHGREWWEYNLWDFQEHQFVTWDVNPTMNGVINGDTTQIAWWQLFSSVDSVPCSVAKWARQLASAQADLSAALSNPTVAWNPDLVNAIHNYVADASSQINALAGVSLWNKHLALARAIEAAKEGVLEPVIASWNTAIAIDPTCLHWANGWIQSTSTGVIGQAFRNMGVMNIDLVQKWTEQVVENVTRAIPIPVWLNTFGYPKSDPRNNSGRQNNNAWQRQAA